MAVLRLEDLKTKQMKTVGIRRKSREIALQILYQIDTTQQDSKEAMEIFWQHFKPEEKFRAFSFKLVAGAIKHKDEIDNLIKKYSENWSLGRMARVDRNILRMAIFELIYCPDIPEKVTLNEAIEVGKIFGSENSGSFINGILDQISKKFDKKEGNLSP